jgi:DNA mismatch repair protein MSH5
VCVRPNIDEELDNRKHVYHGIDSVLVRSSCTQLT